MSGSQKFEEQIVDNLKYLVKQLTTSGKEELNPALMKKLKHICKQSDAYVTKAYYIIMQQFEKKHAEIRFSCFAIIDQLFNRSHCFRCLVLNEFSQLIELVLGSSVTKHVLKPVSVAMKLKKNALIAIKMWYDKYGEAYKLLAVGVDYMINCKHVDFVSMTAMPPGERAQEEERKRLAEELELKRVTKLKGELAEITPQIKSDLTAFKNCFQLLIPNVDNFFIPLSDEMTENNITELTPDSGESDTNKLNVENVIHSNELNIPLTLDENDSLESDISDSEIYGSDYVRSNGILKGTSIKIDLSAINAIQETKDNQFVVENLKELFIYLKSKWLPIMKRMQSLLIPYCERNADTLEYIIKMKTALESAVDSYSTITFIPISKLKPIRACKSKKTDDKVCKSSDSEDDDFIEVTDSDPRVVQAMQSEAELLGLLEAPATHKLSRWSLDSNAGSSSIGGHAAKKIGKNDTSGRNGSNSIEQTQLTSIGKCPSDQTPENFLGEWTPPVLYANPLAGLSQVWLSSSNSLLDDDEDAPRSTGGLLGIATTPINVPTVFEPVRWQCRASLPSGRLCPRRDRVKCPLHGRVLPRSSTTGMPDLDYATAVLSRARQRAGLALDQKENVEHHETDNAVPRSSADTTDSLQTCQERKKTDKGISNTDDSRTDGLGDVRGVQEKDALEVGFCVGAGFSLDTSCEDNGTVVNEDSENAPEGVESKTRKERKQLCSRLNVESGAAVNIVQKTLPTSSNPFKNVKMNENDGIGNELNVSNQTLPPPPSSSAVLADVLSSHNIKGTPVNDEEISVAAAERLVETVKVARLADRRKRMNLDQDWQNPALLAELKAATGVDLDMRNIKKRGRGGRDGGLTDLRKLDATPRKRLAKKVLSKGAMCRLNRALARH